MCILLVGTALVAFGAIQGFVAGWALIPEDPRLKEEVIAFSWGDGKYGPDRYGAEVFTMPMGDSLSVHARIRLSPGNPMWHECGELGQTSTHQEAIRRWGKITWKKDGLHIGNGGPGDYFLPREVVETHR